MQLFIRIGIWVGVVTLALAAIIASLMSPLLEWRQPVYIVAGIAGVLSLALLLFQPMLAGAFLPGVSRLRSKTIHRWVGMVLVLLVGLHVVGLWLTSPPDVIDALLFRSPTAFSAWGVISMWALFASVCLVGTRRRLKFRITAWRLIHRLLAVIIVIGSAVHAMLIEGTMETVSKLFLCVAVVSATLTAVLINTLKK